MLVAILWRPNPNAREFAYVMELSATGMMDDDANDDMNDLELTEQPQQDYNAPAPTENGSSQQAKIDNAVAA